MNITVLHPLQQNSWLQFCFVYRLGLNTLLGSDTEAYTFILLPSSKLFVLVSPHNVRSRAHKLILTEWHWPGTSPCQQLLFKAAICSRSLHPPLVCAHSTPLDFLQLYGARYFRSRTRPSPPFLCRYVLRIRPLIVCDISPSVGFYIITNLLTHGKYHQTISSTFILSSILSAHPSLVRNLSLIVFHGDDCLFFTKLTTVSFSALYSLF